MQFTISEISNISTKLIRIKKYIGKSTQVNLSFIPDNKNKKIKVEPKFSEISFDSIANLYTFSKDFPIPLHKLQVFRSVGGKGKENVDIFGKAKPTLWCVVSADKSREFTSLKFAPRDTPPENLPYLIQVAPQEITEGNYTYRILTDVGGTELSIVSRNDEKLYDYLDKGFYLQFVYVKQKGKKTPQRRVIVSDVLDINTVHIFYLCRLDPSLSELLQGGCFINSYDADILRLRMEKKLSKDNKAAYDAVRAVFDEDYRKNTTLLAVGKLRSKEIDKLSLNDIEITETSAKYQNISVESEGLLDILYSKLNFNGEFDIYTIIGLKCRQTEEAISLPVGDIMGNVQPEAEQEEVRPADGEEQADAPQVEVQEYIVPTFKINEIPITVSVTKTGVRKINGIRINKDEVEKACYRASCCHSEEEYNRFLKSISLMSIRRHDIIANGLPIKIHELTDDELSDPTPGPNAPALKFKIDVQDKCIKLVVSEDRHLKVNLSKLIKDVDSVNRRTNGGWCGVAINGSHYRSESWAQYQLVVALVAATTLTKKEKKENGEVEVTQIKQITKEDIEKLVGVVKDAKKAAIERSKKFLESAVKLTKAEEIEFMGKPAYKVKGKLREYAVVIETAKVYDYATKAYRCIVNDRHYVGAGYDDIAARLLALANDSMMQKSISTLQSAEGQPGAENVHNDYVPERDAVGDLVDKLGIDKLIE